METYNVTIDGDEAYDIESSSIVEAMEIVEAKSGTSYVACSNKVWVEVVAVKANDDGSHSYAEWWLQPMTQKERHQESRCDDS